ncbi:MAG: hypothetical protein DRI90_10365 [Deltaproteobacteria bacterium]|nr:MAG: hypothetical protein DRI90_10365 [Deltaproteobacteria bacterium]
MSQMSKVDQVTTQALIAASEAALAGRTGSAIAAFSRMVEAGSAAAAASLAELSAFGGDWGGVVSNGAKLIAEPTAVYAANVFDDMVQLLGRAGQEGEPWAKIGVVARHGLSELDRSETCEHGRQHLGTTLRSLADYADREGGPPHELIPVFGGVESEIDQEAYRDALDNLLTLQPNLKDEPDDLTRHRFALAGAYRQPDDIVTRFFQAPEVMGFEQAVETAQVLVERGQDERAWEIIEARLGLWWPVDDAQVAPVVLLIDPRLRALMTPERCAMVLATPRGSLAS